VRKFSSLASGVLSAGAVSELAERLLNLARETDLKAVGRLLRG
jgi:hypothetical protein